MLKKMIVLAAVVAAVAAFAIPASASATNLKWTSGGAVVKEGKEYTETFKGVFGYQQWPGGGGSYGCETELKLRVTGPEKAEVTELKIGEPQFCSGTGIYAHCQRTGGLVNTPWSVANGPSTLTITKPGENLAIYSTYKESGGGCPLVGSGPLVWTKFTVTPSGLEPITRLDVSGTTTVGFLSSGSFTPVGTKVLGLK